MSLADIFGRIESGSTTANPNNEAVSSTGARGYLQQFPAFQRQFGPGGSFTTDPQVQQSSLNNFAAQAVRNNPGITLGDLYGEYHYGTGHPGSGPTFANLTSAEQQKFIALGNNPDASVAGIMSNQTDNQSIGIIPADPNQAFPGGVSVDAVTAQVRSGTTAVGNGVAYVGQQIKGVAATIPDAIVKAGNAVESSLSGISEGVSKQVSGAIASAENYGLRGLVMVLAMVILFAGFILLIPRDTKAAAASAFLGKGR